MAFSAMKTASSSCKIIMDPFVIFFSKLAKHCSQPEKAYDIRETIKMLWGSTVSPKKFVRVLYEQIFCFFGSDGFKC